MASMDIGEISSLSARCVVITLPTIYWQVRMWTVVVMNVIEKTEEGRRNLIDNHIHDEMFFVFSFFHGDAQPVISKDWRESTH